MRFLIGFVSGLVAVIALGHSARRSRRREILKIRSDRFAPPLVSRNLARYYRVSLN